MSLSSGDLNPDPRLSHFTSTYTRSWSDHRGGCTLLFLMKLHFGPHAAAPVLNHTHSYNSVNASI